MTLFASANLLFLAPSPSPPLHLLLQQSHSLPGSTAPWQPSPVDSWRPRWLGIHGGKLYPCLCVAKTHICRWSLDDFKMSPSEFVNSRLFTDWEILCGLYTCMSPPTHRTQQAGSRLYGFQISLMFSWSMTSYSILLMPADQIIFNLLYIYRFYLFTFHLIKSNEKWIVGMFFALLVSCCCFFSDLLSIMELHAIFMAHLSQQRLIHGGVESRSGQKCWITLSCLIYCMPC